MSTLRRASRNRQQSLAGAASSSSSIAHLEKTASRSSQGDSVRRQSVTRRGRPANPRLSKTLRRVPVRLPRWMSILRICQCAFAAVVLGAGMTALAIGGRPWLQPALLILSGIACPTFLAMITSLSALPKIMRWKSDHRLCIAGNGLACLCWGLSFSAVCAIENAGAGTAYRHGSWKVPDTEALTAWTAAIMAACASGVEFFLFLASTLVVIYYYHLALVDYRLCKFKSHASYRQKILALEEPLPQPNAPFRKSVGPRFPPKAPGPRVPQRSSLRAIAHLNNQSKYPGLKSKLSQVTKASRSLEELGLEAVSVPLPDSPPPPLELDVFTESSGSFMDPSQHVDVPVFMARSSGRLPLRHFSTSPLSQEVEAFTSPDSTRDSALGISPMYPKSSQPSLLDLALKSPRVPPKKRPTPLAPIVLPAPKLSSRSPPKQFSEVLNESSWPLPAAASVQTSRSASFSSTRPRNELAVPREIARASSFSSTQRRTELIVPLENPRTAPLSPAQQKEEIVRRKSVIQAALNKEKEELARRRSQKRETVNQEKMEVARTKSLQRETLHQEKKTEIIRLKSLRRESSTKEKSDLVRFKSVSLKRENSKSAGSASFAENAKRFSTLAPSFRIGKTKTRPNLSLRVSTLAGSTADDAVTKRPSWVFGRPGAADTLDSPPLTSLTFSNWGECNQSKDHIPAPPSSPATFAASIKTNKKRISFQKQKKAAKAKAAAAEKVKAKALKREKAKQDELRKSNCSPEAERYHTRSPYDFSSSSSSSSDDEYDDDECGDADSDIFAIDTNCLPGSAHQQNPLAHPPYEESKNWSTTTHFGDGRDNRRSLSIYSHSVYSVDTQGFPPSHNTHSHNHPPHLFSTAANGTTTRRHPMSSLNPSHSHTTTTTTTTTTTNNNNNNTPSPGFMSQETMRVTPLFHRVSLHQFSARASLNAGLVGTTAGFVSGEYEEEIEELAREFLEDEDGGVV